MADSSSFKGKWAVEEAPNYGFATTPTVVPPEQLVHIYPSGQYLVNALGQYVGTLVYETADPTPVSKTGDVA